MKKILAFDVGEKMIGCALADGRGVALEPLPPIIRNQSLSLGSIRKLIKEHDVGEVVVGVPLLNGKKSQQTRKIKGYVYKMKKHFPDLPISLQDETLSTWVTRKKYPRLSKNSSSFNIDSFSAMEILRDYLENKDHA